MYGSGSGGSISPELVEVDFHALLHTFILVTDEEIEVVFGKQGFGLRLVCQFNDYFIGIHIGCDTGSSGINHSSGASTEYVVYFTRNRDNDTGIPIFHVCATVVVKQTVRVVERCLESSVGSSGGNFFNVGFADTYYTKAYTKSFGRSGSSKGHIELDALDVVCLSLSMKNCFYV